MREQHGKDISFHEAHLPDAVVFAESAEEVQQIVQLCARHKTPMIAFGTGTSLEGHISAPNGGISLDVSRMNKVLAVNEADLDAVVQPGVTRKQLNEYIAPPACSSRSIPAPTPRSAAWPARAPRAPTRCATAPCARTCWRCRSSRPTAG